MYEWRLDRCGSASQGGDEEGLTLDPKDSAKLTRGFTRWLMTNLCEMWDDVPKTRAPGSVFVLLRAPRGLAHTALAPRQDLQLKQAKALHMNMTIQHEVRHTRSPNHADVPASLGYDSSA